MAGFGKWLSNLFSTDDQKAPQAEPATPSANQASEAPAWNQEQNQQNQEQIQEQTAQETEQEAVQETLASTSAPAEGEAEQETAPESTVEAVTVAAESNQTQTKPEFEVVVEATEEVKATAEETADTLELQAKTETATESEVAVANTETQAEVAESVDQAQASSEEFDPTSLIQSFSAKSTTTPQDGSASVLERAKQAPNRSLHNLDDGGVQIVRFSEGKQNHQISKYQLGSAAQKPTRINGKSVTVDAATLAPAKANPQATAQAESQSHKAAQTATVNPTPEVKKGFFKRLVSGLAKTSSTIGAGIAAVFVGKRISKELFTELEDQLLIADVGVSTTDKIITNLTNAAKLSELKDSDALYSKLKDELRAIVKPCSQPLVIDESKKPYLILMVGVNGVGKTTTIGKLTKKLQAQGKSVILAAADTFRAAAIEQLQEWGVRNDVPVVAQKPGADSAAVIYDAMQKAKAHGTDVVIADTAGRLQNKAHLLEELRKIIRVVQRIDPTAPHEVLITLDASTGQNAISQVENFDKAVDITGIVLTKLDGTAKGGVIFAVADKFGKPIRYIGVGEGIDDLQEFNAEDFIEALFTTKA